MKTKEQVYVHIKSYEVAKEVQDVLEKNKEQFINIEDYTQYPYLKFDAGKKCWITSDYHNGGIAEISVEKLDEILTQKVYTNQLLLDPNKTYNLEELTSDERIKLLEQNGFKDFFYSDVIAYEDNVGWFFCKEHVVTTNAKELFYTLDNIQVDCRDLSEGQIKEMANVFEANGFCVEYVNLHLTEQACYLHNDETDCSVYFKDENKHTITYEKFMELFGNIKQSEEQKSPRTEEESFLQQAESSDVFNPQPHYDNSKGSLYKIGTERNWNPYLFDVVKRLERGGKKDPLKKEIEKSIDVLKIWLNEL